MQIKLKLLYALILSQLLALQANAILGGRILNQEKLQQKVIQFDVRKGQASIVCTGSFISDKKILTAAHCLKHIQEPCNDCDQKIYINKVKYDFTYFIHPDYIKLNKNKNYTSTNNYDIAVIEVPTFSNQGAFKLNFNFKDNNQPLSYLGYGMSKVKKINTRDNIIYQESKRGLLKVGQITNRNIQNGLLKKEVDNITIGKGNYLNIHTKSQVLRSDSGGPLIEANRIVGIIRNYEIIDQVEQFIIGRDLSSNIKNIKMRSTFTLINNKKTKKFLQHHL